MGYYSDVRSIIYGPPDDVLTFWTQHKLAGNAALNDHWLSSGIRRYTVDSGDGTSVIDLRMDSVKWYPDYTHVDAWMSLLDEIDGESPGTEKLSYEHIEIGENNDDLTTRTGGADIQYWLGVSRSIVEDMPPQQKDSTNEQDAESQSKDAA